MGEHLGTCLGFVESRLANEQVLLRGMLSAGGLAAVAEAVGGHAVQTAIVESLAPYRTPSGGYRLENEWHYLIASA